MSTFRHCRLYSSPRAAASSDLQVGFGLSVEVSSRALCVRRFHPRGLPDFQTESDSATHNLSGGPTKTVSAIQFRKEARRWQQRQCHTGV